MENRVAVISIIVEDRKATDQLNSLLHEYGQFIIGRMGLPTRRRIFISSALPLMHRSIPSMP